LGADPQRMETPIVRLEEKVKQGYFADLLALPQNDRMITTEVNARLQQQLIGFSPIVSRFITEFLAPLIERVYSELLKDGAFGTSPDSLKGEGALGFGNLEVVFISAMAISQRASEIGAVNQHLTFLAPFAEAKGDPGIFRGYDDMKIFYHSAQLFNIPPELYLSKKEWKDAVAEQQKQDESQRALAELESGSKSAKNVEGLLT